jgi:class 3 adenylate cyclase
VRELDSAAQAFNRMVDGLRERERIRRLFGRYVPVDVVDEVLAQPGGVMLGGERRSVTLMFTDIEGFTTLSEQLPPEQLVAMLNDYLRVVSRAIAEADGTIVDFIGDGVFAMFGAPAAQPDHAARGLACARAVAAATAAFAEAQRRHGVPLGRTRIGVHSGIATVGHFGSDDRVKYSAIGDLANTASRLEGANKAFGTAILASAATVEQAGDGLTRPVARVVLKGRQAALTVHEVLSERPAWLDDYRAAYVELDAGVFGAEAAWYAMLARLPGDPVAALHRRRADATTLVALDEK